MRNVRRNLCLVLLCFLLVGILMPMTAKAASLEVAKVEAVGTGYEYDSTKGAYVPTFSSITAYDSTGSKINVPDFTWTTAFYTTTSFVSSNKLTTEPVNGETYYFGIYVDQYINDISYDYTSAGDMMNNSVVTLPGFTVECISFMEREMGSYLELTYSATRISDIYVGGVGMVSGDYLASGATATTTTKPADNYAYYEDGVLTLHNYTYSGLGYEVNSNTFAAIYAPEDVTIKLEGENSITKTSGGATNEYAFNMRNNLTLLKGTDGAKLTATSSKVGIFVQKDLTIESGIYHITAEQRDPIYVKEGNIQIKDGTFVLNAQRTGLQTYTGGITIENGTFHITAATSMGISCNSNLIIKDGAFTIVSEENGLWTTGNCTIENGTFKITSGDEGIQVDGESLVIKDGDFTITGKTGIDCANVSSVIEGGNIRITSNSQGIRVDGHELIIKGGEVTIDSSSSGIALGDYASLTIEGGEVTIDSLGSGIRLGDAADLIIEGGKLEIDTGTGDGIYSPYEYSNVSVRGGNVRITGATYGINCDQLTIEGGDLVVIAENENGHALYTADTIIASTLYAGGTTELGAELEVFDPAKEFDYVHVEVRPTPFVRVPEVWVGGVNLSSGEYLAVGGLAPTTTQPTGGYAHYDSGVLTLHNYTYSGKGYNYKNNPYTEYAFIYTMVDCTIVLEGTNTLTWEGTYLQYDRGRGIVPLGALTVTAASADASLTMVTDENGILASTAVAITGGNINVDATDSGRGIDIKTGGSLTIQNTNLYVASYTEAIFAEDCGIAIENSTLELWPNGDEGIYAADDITITDSHVEIQTADDCIATTGTVTVNGSSFLNLRSTSTSSDSSYSALNVDALVVDPALTVQASVDAFSGLGTYVDANRATYDWVVISETGITSPDIYVGGIGMANGQYLATGATVPTTTQPTGGYAHYASGVLTLHDYTYTGTGFAYDSGLFVAVLCEGDLTVNLEGTNVLDCQTPGGEYDGSSGLYILGNLVLDAAENASLSIHTVVPSGGVSPDAAICAYGSFTVRDGTYTLENGIQVGANLTIEDGTFHITTSVSGTGLYSGQDITIKGGSFTIDGGYYSIGANDQIVIENGIFTLTPDGTGLFAYNGSVTIKNGVLNINCMDTGIKGYAGVNIQSGNIAIQSMDQGIATGSGSSVTIAGGDTRITAVYEGIYADSTNVTGGNMSVKSTDTSNDSAWCAIDSALTVASDLPIQASTEPTGGLGAYEAAAHDSYDWIVIGTIEDTPMSYAVNLYKNPYGVGTVTGAGMYEAGTSVTVTAIPDEHHNFANWTEGGVVVSTNASYTFTIAANRDLTANFQPKSYALNVSASPAVGGTVTGGGTYTYNTYVTVTATANPGYHFVKWTKEGVDFSTNATESFSLEGNCDLVAVFEPDIVSYAVAVSASPAGSGTVTGAGTYIEGSAVTVTATANAGYHFVKWTEGGADVSTDAAYTFYISANRNLVAVFEVNPTTYTVAVSANPAEGGTVTGGGSYEEGNSVTVTATANTGYHFVKWTEGGADVSTDAAYTFTVTANRNLVAVFEADAPVPVPTYTVAVSASPAEGGTVAGGGTFEEGSSVTVTATANSGYHFVKWMEGDIQVSTDAAYTFTVTANRNLVAVFEADAPAPVPAYAVTVSVSPAEGGTVTGGGSYEEGTSITVTAIANSGYHFVKWMEGDIQVSTDAAYTFTVTANRDLVAVFEADAPVPVPTYTVAVSASPAEGGTVTGGGTYNEGELITVTATPNAGYHFVKWTEAGAEVCATEGYAFTVSANRNLVAVFEADAPDPIPVTYTVSVSASPAEGGTVTGGGTFEEGSSVTVTATANTGYHFVKWTEGGADVSTDAAYSFTASANRTLVAVFEADTPAPTDPTDPIPVTYTISVSASPAEGGTVTGGGSYTDGATVTVTATANTGYHFVKWTENGAEVCSDTNYTFSVIADVNLVAVFEADAPTPPPAGGTLNGMFRLAGPSRYDTGFAIANKLKEILGVDKFSAVIVAYGQNFPDALTGSYLAAVKGAPILLTEPSADANLLNYLTTNLVSGGKVYILGGTAAVSQKFEDGAKDLGFDVKRLKGAGRYETNLEILKEAGVNTTDEVLIATGKNYADSLSASATGLPMLLVDKNLTDSQKAFLQNTSKKFVILGGTGAVSAEVEAELDAIGDVTRVKGASRYGTSVEIAKRYFNAPSAAVLAYAQGFPDGLCGGPLAFAVGAPLILTSNESSQLADEYVAGITSGAVTGGTARISDDTVREIFDLPANTPIVKP